MSLTPDPRALRSRAALLNAARQLVDARDIGSIAITDVCALAGVSRPTFYQHFGDIATLVQAAAIERLEQVFDATAAVETLAEPAVMLETGVRRLMQGLAEHAPFYRRVLEETSVLAVQALVIDFVAARLLAFVERSGAADPEEIKSRVRLLAAGAAWLVMEQLGDRRDPDGLDSAATRIAQQLAQSLVEGGRA